MAIILKTKQGKNGTGYLYTSVLTALCLLGF